MIESEDSPRDSGLTVNPGSTPDLQPKSVVLVVDDDPAIRLVIRHAMQQNGYHVIEAGNGLEAVQFSIRQIPDLILMDAVMPEMDGFRATEEIRKIEACDDTPILMATSLDDDDSIARAFNVGACDYITKPFNWSVLKHRVRRMLQAANAQRRIQHLAYHDVLTGLPNRMLFMDRIDQAISRAQREEGQFALLFIDIDHFKVINDSMGHDAGDQLLNLISIRLRDVLRKSDTVARLGGDEFTVIIEYLQHPDDVIQITKNILSALDLPAEVNGKEVYVGGSIGIAMYPQDGENFGVLLKNADTAMYKAKELGRNTFQFYASEMSHKAMQRLELENQIRTALKEDQFEVYYQPKVDLQNNKCIGVEALVRWNHPQRGLISPDDFVPLTEEIGLITQLDEWMMKAACLQFMQWKQQGYPLNNLSVNISSRHFKEGNLIEYCTTLLEMTGIAAECLEIELTESALVDNYSNAKYILDKLHTMGLRIALDDFGTGYASMAYLKEFPFDTVKIDRSFIRDIPQDHEDAAIVTAMIQLSQALKLNIVAEGIETDQQRQFLYDNACGYGQGYLWSRPVSAAELDCKNFA
ncbi:MAG TPA: EAL domain-containing protein [Gammaproteobacteria bacterium]